MKKLSFLLLYLLSSMYLSAQNYYICKDRTYQTINITEGTTIPTDWTDIDSITFSVPQFPTTPTTNDTVCITYNGTTASVAIPEQYKNIVTSNVDGANVTVSSTISDAEIIYQLSGTSTSGSFVFNGSYKATFVLNGLTLTSTTGAAIDIECGKRIAIELAPGTVNTLTDYSGGEQKACLYVKGHTEISKEGALIINGNVKHGISSKEYVLIKKTTGSITVNSAPKDGIHAGQYFKMNGGKVSILNGVLGDGIQAETTSDATDELNGQMIINGGEININIKGNYSKCLKVDSLLTITDGTLNLTNAGASGEDPGEVEPTPTGPTYKLYVAVSTKTSGGGGGFGGETSYYWNQDHVYLYNSSNTLVATLTNKVTVTSGYTTKTFFEYDFGKATSGTTYYFKSDNYSGGRSTYVIQSGTITPTLDGSSNVFYVISDSYSTSGSTRTFSVSDQTSTYKNGTISTGGGSGDITYATCIKAEEYLQEGGNITATATGLAGRGISVDGNMTIKGGTNTIKCSGNGQLIGTSDSYAARGYKIDSNLYLLGGTHTITMTGTGGKAIKVDGNAVIGDTDIEGLKLTASTSGSAVSNSSGGGGGFGGGGGESSFVGSTKAFKIMGTYTQNNGDLYITITTDGAEGIESKSTMTFNGGSVYAKCYDDCINSAGKMTFNGTIVYCYGTGNDAIDCNYNTTGGITIQGGAVCAFSTKGSPEEGIDIDNMSNLVIKGGYMFCGGGKQSSVSSLSSSSTQSYGIYSSSVSLTSGRYYTLLNSSNQVQLTVKMPATVSSQLTILTAPGMTKSTTNYVKYSSSAPTNATSQFDDYVYIGGTTGTLTQSFSFTSK